MTTTTFSDLGYAENLRIASRPGIVTRRSANLIASGVNGWVKSVAKAVEEVLSAKVAENRDRFAADGTKFKGMGLTGTVTFTRCFDGAYGTTQLVKILLTTGHTLSWFASSVTDLNVGDDVAILGGSVKGYDAQYGATKVTRMNVTVTNAVARQEEEWEAPAQRFKCDAA